MTCLGDDPTTPALQNNGISCIHFPASHNSCCNGDRPNDCRSLLEQLDVGIRLLEFDFFGGHLQHLGRFEMGHASPGKEIRSSSGNPRSMDLEKWLQTVNAWAQMRNWSIGGPLFLVLDAKDEFPLIPLNETVRNVFGSRIFGPDELERWCPLVDGRQTWPTALQLDGRVIIVLSGSERARMSYLRDQGRDAAVASNVMGIVVEVHRSHRSNSLWFWLGCLEHEGNSIEWLQHGQYTSGVTPTVAFIDDFWVVEVHKSQNRDILWYCVARVHPQTRDLSWYPAQELKPQPAHAMQPKLELIDRVLYLSCLADGSTWYCTGQLGSPGIVDWSAWEHSPPPLERTVPELSVRSTPRFGSEHTLVWQHGEHTGLIRPHQLLFVEAQPRNDQAPLIDYGTHFLAWRFDAKIDAALVQRWYSEGRLMRHWKFNHKSWHLDRNPQPHFPATDFPFDSQYTEFLERLRISSD